MSILEQPSFKFPQNKNDKKNIPIINYSGNEIDEEDDLNENDDSDEDDNSFNIDDDDNDDDDDEDSGDDDDVMNNNDEEEESDYNDNKFNSELKNNKLSMSSIVGGASSIVGGADSDDDDDDDDDDDSDDDSDDENYLQKFDNEIRDNIIEGFHPECKIHNYEEVKAMSRITRNTDGVIIDDLHKTVPFLTKYEKTSIIGQRAKQINSGSIPFIDIPNNIMDGYLIALMELEQKKIPFIIKRPIPDGSCEYWNVHDLEIIN